MKTKRTSVHPSHRAKKERKKKFTKSDDYTRMLLARLNVHVLLIDKQRQCGIQIDSFAIV